MSSPRTIAGILSLVTLTSAVASDCITFELFRLSEHSDGTLDGSNLQFVQRLPISSDDIIEIQTVTAVGKPNPQNVSEVFEMLEGNLEGDETFEQYFVRITLSQSATNHLDNAAKDSDRNLLRISRDNLVVTQSWLVDGSGTYSNVQYETATHDEAVELENLIGASCD